MGTAAEQSIGIGSPVVLPDGTVAMIDASDGHVAECVWFVGLDVQRASHPLIDLRAATAEEVDAANAKWGVPGAATPPGAAPLAPPVTESAASASDAPAAVADAPAPTTFELLVGFLNWLGTRDEIVGPLSRIHPSNPSQAPRLAAEYLSEQA